MKDIVTRYQAQRFNEQERQSTLKMFMKSPNKYAAGTESEKIVQIKMMDVFYYNKVCTLIYLVDISKLLNKENSSVANVQQNVVL